MKRYLLLIQWERHDELQHFETVDAAKEKIRMLQPGVPWSCELWDKETDSRIPFRWKPPIPPPVGDVRQMRDPENGRPEWEEVRWIVSSAGPNVEYRIVADPRTIEQRIADYLEYAKHNRIGPWWNEETEPWPGTPWSEGEAAHGKDID